MSEKVSKQYKKTAKKQTRSLFWALFKLGILLAIWGAFFLSLFITYYMYDLPDIDEMTRKDARPQITIRDQENVILARYGDAVGKTLPYSQIPSHMINAVIAAEDRRFFEHIGIDPFGILRAYLVNLSQGRLVQGGSTITQQLAKIIYLSPERTFKRKIQEALIALQLERKFSKEQIITMYLNRVYLAKGNYGIDAASRFYFGKKAQDIDAFEGAVLAAMLKAPSRYAPSQNSKLVMGRAKYILKAMRELGYLSDLEYKSAFPPAIVARGSARGTLKNPYFADYVLQQLSTLIENSRQDIEVITTLNLHAQETLENAMKNTMNSSSDYKTTQAAAISMEPNGAIKAMMGGISYENSQYNRAVSAKRQSGSVFKFFVYAQAMEQGYDLDSKFEDKEIAYFQAHGLPLWEPQNYNKKFQGVMSLEEAFAKSINTIAVQLSEEVGRAKTIKLAHNMGIESYIPNLPSMALGVSDTSLLELTQSIANIANDGKKTRAFGILKVTTLDGQVLYEFPGVSDEQSISSSANDKMKSLLKAVVDDGTGKQAQIPFKTVYGKTGTTQDYKDAWFIGFDEQLVTGVWVGNDDNSPMNRVVGGSLPANIWKQYHQNVGLITSTSLPEKSFFERAADIFDLIESGK